jgi:hypothetical protein
MSLVMGLDGWVQILVIRSMRFCNHVNEDSSTPIVKFDYDCNMIISYIRNIHFSVAKVDATCLSLVPHS